MAEWDLLFWKLIMLRADIGIFLLMVRKLILSIFGLLDTSSFAKLGQQWPEVFFWEMRCAKGTHYVAQDVLSIILDGLDEKSNPKQINELSSHVGESPPIEQLESWCIGFNHLLNQRISWKSQEHFTGSGHCPGSWVTKEWQMVWSGKLVKQD